MSTNFSERNSLSPINAQVYMAPDRGRGAWNGHQSSNVSRILLLDSRPLMAQAVEKFLAGNETHNDRWSFHVGTFASYETVPDDQEFDLVFLYVPESAVLREVMNDCMNNIPERHRKLPFVLYTEGASSEEVAAALQEGAIGYLPASLDCNLILDALCLISSGLSVFPPLGDGTVVAAGQTRDSDRLVQSNVALTEREQDVLVALKQGKSNKSIARDLGVSLSTVKVHIRSLFRKIGARNRTEAAIAADRILAFCAADRPRSI